ncbi:MULTISPECIES: ribokinase [Gammaproteobacteria]|uniref:ribokinase n=1 Tax=Gammaproteobacteria TaxID=1236 RepID=UPI0018687C0D|nr:MULTISPECIES: PfkB family carbohydrate kinase [Gammaproteobacteria]
MKKKSSIAFIRKKLIKDNSIYVKELSVLLHVSERTVRRYIDELQLLGIATKFHGGVKLQKIELEPIITQTIDETKVIHINSQKQKRDRKDVDKCALYILGSFNLDVVTEVERFPFVGETIKAISTNFFPGGKGANQAAAASELNDNVHFFVKVGDDSFGATAEKYFSTTKIGSYTLIKDPNAKTGNALVMVENSSGNNSIVIDLGANATITKAEILSDINHLQSAKIFLTQLENNIEATKFAIEIAKKSGCYIILNPAPYSDQIISHLPSVDLLVPNGTEAELISNIKIDSVISAQEAIKAIYNLGVKEIVMTLGDSGALYFNGTTMKYYKAMSASVVDTSGAGDAFTGSLAANLIEGKNIDEAIKFSIAYASLAVEKKGASSMPSRTSVAARLKKECM